MTDLKLEVGEGILLQTNDAGLYDGNNETDIDELYLTNKNLICVFEKSTGVFKSESVVHKIPLSTIAVVNGIVQVEQVDDIDYGKSLQIIYTNGRRELLELNVSPKKQYPAWKAAISNAVIRLTAPTPAPQPVPTPLPVSPQANPAPQEAKPEKVLAGASLFAGIKGAVDAAKQTFSEVAQTATEAFGGSPKTADTQTTNTNEGSVMEEKKYIFCSNCGEKLAAGSKFCNSCGTPTAATTPPPVAPKVEPAPVTPPPIQEPIVEPLTERKTVYEGDIHKCPNCGEVLESFVVNCPSCGHEIRGTKNSLTVREFAAKLEAIERTRPSKGFGIKKLLENQTSVNETDLQKISLIRSFVIPNTKEDLFEFLVLASSNINLQRYNDFDSISESEKAVSDAWEAKFEQAYEKAKLSFGTTAEFKKIQSIYEKKNAQITNSKKKKKYFWIGIAAIFIIIPILSITLILSMNSSDANKIATENARLEAIVDEVYEAIADENYVLARAKAASLVFSGSTSLDGEQAAEKWDKTRAELLAIIGAAENGEVVDVPDDNTTDSNATEGDKSPTDNTVSTQSPSTNTPTSAIISGDDDSVEVTIQNNDYLVVKEFAWFKPGDYLKCAIVIHNTSSDKAIEYPTFRVTAYDANNKVLGSEEQTLSVIYPQQDFVCYQLLFEPTSAPARITVTLVEPDDYNITSVSSLDHPQFVPMVGQNISVNTGDLFESVTGELYNSNDYKFDSAMVTVIFRDKDGKIFYAEHGFVDKVPANGTIPFDIDISVDGKEPATCEVYGYPW
ncbi:MAG: zinc-ribbon domain-containing protein [Oscillospiraceae bacterium]|nr:zinc-ribbon domain-containing protein [Oscillospiraceae bacterium]